MRKVVGTIAAIIATSYSFSLLSYDFSQADSLFKQRGSGFSASTQARKEYAKSLKHSLSQDEKVYAVSQMSRLDIYRGAMVDGVDKSRRKKVLE